MLPLRICHWAALLAICFWVGYVAAAPLPGVQWSRLSVWEASALADVWARSSEYLDFRFYALGGLSDLGYLDHLLDDFAPTLRALAGYGAKTGLVCVGFKNNHENCFWRLGRYQMCLSICFFPTSWESRY